MNQKEKCLKGHVLSLLMNAPSPVAAIYSALVRRCKYWSAGNVSERDVSNLLDTLKGMEERQWVRARQMTETCEFREVSDEDRRKDREAYMQWLVRARLKELAVDEIGLFYEIQPLGRQECRESELGDGREGGAVWSLDAIPGLRTIFVQAENSELAGEALQSWLYVNKDVQVLEETRKIEPLDGFQTRDGTVVPNGVRLTIRYKTTK